MKCDHPLPVLAIQHKGGDSREVRGGNGEGTKSGEGILGGGGEIGEIRADQGEEI